MGLGLVLRDMGALAAARRMGTTLESEQLKAAAPSDRKGEEAVQPKAASEAAISKPLEALRAVIPATIATLYSALVIPMQTLAISAGADAKAQHAADLAKSLGNDTVALKAALDALPVETDTFLFLRIGVAGIVALFVYIAAYRKAQEGLKGTAGGNRTAYFEPLVATAAFVVWALASPGTFLAAVLTAKELPIYSLAIAGVGAIGLVALSTTTLSKKAGDAPPAV